MTQPDFSSRRSSTPRSPGWDRALVLAAGALLLLAILNAVRASSELEQTRQVVARARTETDAAEAQADRLRAGPERARLARERLASAATPTRILAELEPLLPSEVRIDGITLSYGAAIDLDLRVVARNAAAYDVFLERLGSAPSFARVSPGEENREGEVQSTVKVAYVGGAP